eukprot:SM000278S10013  [mRNA]  locus=s278:134756:135912:- [translate_table: standard]
MGLGPPERRERKEAGTSGSCWGGEQGLKTEDGLKRLYRDDAKPTVAKVKQALADLSEDAVGAFDKELAGLTGGFPGGEQGLREFLTKYPPPQKMSKEMQALREQLAAPVSRPAPIRPPLLMPGMTVRVNNPNDIYHQYTGIVQRVTDGKVGVLFEGGNWDKLVAFDLEEVQRTKKGPPGNNPKSAILLEDEDS